MPDTPRRCWLCTSEALITEHDSVEPDPSGYDATAIDSAELTVAEPTVAELTPAELSVAELSVAEPVGASADAPRRAWRRGADMVIAAVALVTIALVGWTMHANRGGGQELVPIGKDSGDLTAAVTVRANFPMNTLEIPSQKVTAPIDPVTVDKTGYLGIPADVKRVGWYTGAGQLDGNGPGSVLLDGHVNWVSQGTGALGNIGFLHLGDVAVTRGKGKTQAWRVINVVSYLKEKGLPAEIFRKTGKRDLVLVTCGGTFDASTGNYLSNIVVHLQPVTTLHN